MKEVTLVDHEYEDSTLTNQHVIARTRSRFVDKDYDDMTDLGEERLYNEIMKERGNQN